MINDYVTAAILFYLLGSLAGALMWLYQGILVMYDDEVRVAHSYTWWDVFMCFMFGALGSWVGIVILVRGMTRD